MGKAINPIGFLDLTSSPRQEESLERVKQILWIKIWPKVNLCILSGILLLGGNIFYWYHIRNPERQIIIATISLAVFIFLFLRFLRLLIALKSIENKMKNETQKQQAEYYIKLAKEFDSRVFRFKATDKNVLELQTELKHLFNSFQWKNIDDKSFEIEVQF